MINPEGIQLEKSFQAEPQKVFRLFSELHFFKLTGADKLEIDFSSGGEFHFIYDARGVIYGHFIEISPEEIILNWNVTGFQKPNEKDTILKITMTMQNDHCVLHLSHTGIMNEESFLAKQNAWTEILEKVHFLVTDLNE